MRAVDRLSTPSSRADLIDGYAAYYIPADRELGPWLNHIADLDWARRSRAALLDVSKGRNLPDFPAPASCAESLGMLYVVEGSTLGGRLILKSLSNLGVDVSDLQFLDPYGAKTGMYWRSFLVVLERETRNAAARDQACRGAVSAFAHAERLLCGEDA